MIINPNDYTQLIQIMIAVLFGVNILAFLSKKQSLQLWSNLIILCAISLALYGMFSGNIVQKGFFNINQFSELLALLLTVSMALINILSYGEKSSYRAFAMFASFSLLGMYSIAFAGNFILVLIGLELMVMPTLFAILVSKSRSLEAAVKLFIISALSISILSFGIALFYGSTNTISFVWAPTSKVIEIALVFIVAALGFEASLFPFNLWVPDTYQASPTYITAMLGGVNKKVGFIALMEIMLLVFVQYQNPFAIALSAIAVLTMFYGNIVALAQKNVKRLMAYSAISQSGYILIGIAVGTQYGITASIFQIIAHSFIFIGIMAVVMYMEQKGRHTVNDYLGLFNDNKFAAVSLTIFFLALIGIPFTSGFVGKFLLFSSAVYGNLVLLAIIGVINSIISVYYYLKVIMPMFANKEKPLHFTMSKNIFAVILICLLVTLVFGIYPNPIINAASAAASALIGV